MSMQVPSTLATVKLRRMLRKDWSMDVFGMTHTREMAVTNTPTLLRVSIRANLGSSVTVRLQNMAMVFSLVCASFFFTQNYASDFKSFSNFDSFLEVL